MSSDPTKQKFNSKYRIDKIPTPELTKSISQGATSSTTTTYTNPYGKKAFITLGWSVDGVNFYPAGVYTDAAASYTVIGHVTAGGVHIYTENNTGGTISFTVKYVLDTLT